MARDLAAARELAVDLAVAAGRLQLERRGEVVVGSKAHANDLVSDVDLASEKLIVRLDVKAAAKVTDFVFGFGLFNADGVCVYGTNTDLEDLDPSEIDGGGQVDFVIEPLGLIEGTYKIDVAVHRRDGYPYDYHRLLYTFRVKSRTKDVGIFRPPHRWVFSDGVKLITRI